MVDFTSVSTSGAVCRRWAARTLPTKPNHPCHPLASPLPFLFHCFSPSRRDAVEEKRQWRFAEFAAAQLHIYTKLRRSYFANNFEVRYDIDAQQRVERRQSYLSTVFVFFQSDEAVET